MDMTDKNQAPPAYVAAPPPQYAGSHTPSQTYPGNTQLQAYPQPPGNAQPQAYPPHAGYDQPQEYGQPQGCPTNTIATTRGVPTSNTVVLVSGNLCPRCGVGYLSEDYTSCGIVLAVLFFPWGLICCMAMKEKSCSHCSATFD